MVVTFAPKANSPMVYIQEVAATAQQEHMDGLICLDGVPIALLESIRTRKHNTVVNRVWLVHFRVNEPQLVHRVLQGHILQEMNGVAVLNVMFVLPTNIELIVGAHLQGHVPIVYVHPTNIKVEGVPESPLLPAQAVLPTHKVLEV